jgi:PAS domain S-box-containing protein
MSDSQIPSDGLLSILESMSDGFCAVDKQWRLVYLNGRAELITHQAKAELLGKLIWDAFPDTIGSVFYQHYHRQEAHDLKLRFEIFCSSINSWLEVRSMPSPFGLAFYFHDITEQRRGIENLKDLNDQLFAERAYLESILQHVPAGVVICEAPSGRVLYGNERIQEIFGRPGGNAETVNEYIKWEGFHPDGSQYEPHEWPLARSISTGEIVSGEEIHAKHQDGKKMVLLVSSSPIRDKAGRILAGIVIDHDISERHKSAHELKALGALEAEARQAAEAANKAKDQFIAVLSHELRTPLTPVLLALTAMEASAQFPEDAHQDLVMMRRNVELEMRLIDDLLDVSRISTGKMRLEMKPTNVHGLLQNVCEMLRASEKAKGQRISLELNAQNDGILGDNTRLQQVFWNVLKNAIKFGFEKSEICVRTSNPTPATIAIQVTNSGTGIPAQALPRIFIAFEQADATAASQFGGLGLGLTIARAILDLHGGAIGATSGGEGQGACFTIDLTTLHAQEKLIGLAVKDPVSLAPISLMPVRVRLLVVEDHADTRRLLARLLTAQGYQVSQAATVAAGLAIAAATPIDVLVSDIGLPDATGHELMRQFKALYDAPGIALSGYGMDSDIQASLDAGFYAHLTKPTNIAALYSTLKKALGSKGAPMMAA